MYSNGGFAYMNKEAFLVLEDGSFYEGLAFGAGGFSYGEVVFNTGMTGYQEMLTDPSYAGQILVSTYPLIGNYGINEQDFESERIQVGGFVVREACHLPSHWQSNHTLHEFLVNSGICGISGVDTRAITRRLRSKGVMMGAIACDKSPQETLKELRQLPRYDSTDFLQEVSTKTPYEWEASSRGTDSAIHIAVLDCGLKRNILRILSRLGCRVSVLPCTSTAEEVLDFQPDGILLSPGPGDPALLDYVVETVRGLVGKKAVMGICLGEQLIARAFGAKTFKLKFGHRGSNHPVRDLLTGSVLITAQNHGYAVDADSLKNGLEVSHLNLNDDTVEGLYHRELPLIAIQYHSEASPGPRDSTYMFNKFISMVEAAK